MKHFLPFIYIFIISFSTIWAHGPVVLVVGTRAQSIKIMPVNQAFKEQHIPVLLCATGQHPQLLNDTFATFSIVPDINRNIMKEFSPETKPSLVYSDIISAMAEKNINYMTDIIHKILFNEE